VENGSGILKCNDLITTLLLF